MGEDAILALWGQNNYDKTTVFNIFILLFIYSFFYLYVYFFFLSLFFKLFSLDNFIQKFRTRIFLGSSINLNFATAFDKSWCYFAALVRTYFRLRKGLVPFIRPETILADFLHPLLLVCKLLINHFSKFYFAVLLVTVTCSWTCRSDPFFIILGWVESSLNILNLFHLLTALCVSFM